MMGVTVQCMHLDHCLTARCDTIYRPTWPTADQLSLPLFKIGKALDPALVAVAGRAMILPLSKKCLGMTAFGKVAK
jgi:hypothetical protein